MVEGLVVIVFLYVFVSMSFVRFVGRVGSCVRVVFVCIFLCLLSSVCVCIGAQLVLRLCVTMLVFHELS